jgi:hypothetical protein
MSRQGVVRKPGLLHAARGYTCVGEGRHAVGLGLGLGAAGPVLVRDVMLYEETFEISNQLKLAATR